MFKKDEWLASVLEREVFRVQDSDLVLDKRAVQKEISSLPKDYFAFSKISCVDVEKVKALNAVGFTVVDVNLTFEQIRDPAFSPNKVVLVESAQKQDEALVLEIAETCFKFSRFHLDPVFDKPVANKIKRQWVQSYFDGDRGEEVLVAKLNGKPVGFLAVLSANEVYAIDLIGVKNDSQGKGIGNHLVCSFIERYRGRNKRLVVGTQAANIPSVRLYERAGFTLLSSQFVLHAHGTV